MEVEGPVFAFASNGEVKKIPAWGPTSDAHFVQFEVGEQSFHALCNVCQGGRRGNLTEEDFYVVCAHFNARVCTWPEGTPSPRTQYNRT